MMLNILSLFIASSLITRVRASRAPAGQGYTLKDLQDLPNMSWQDLKEHKGEWVMRKAKQNIIPRREEFTSMGALTQDLDFNILTNPNSLLIWMPTQSLALRMAYGKTQWNCQHFFGIISNKWFLLDLIFVSPQKNTLGAPLAREALVMTCYAPTAVIQAVTANTRRNHTWSITWKRETGPPV